MSRTRVIVNIIVTCWAVALFMTIPALVYDINWAGNIASGIFAITGLFSVICMIWYKH